MRKVRKRGVGRERQPGVQSGGPAIEITLKLFATLGDHLPHELNGRRRVYNQLAMDVPDGTTVQQVIERFGVPAPMAHLVLVNGVFVPRGERPARALMPGDEVAVWPPIAGG